jgi:predicted metal-dependent peptidase
MDVKQKISRALTKLLLSPKPEAPFFSSCVMQLDIEEKASAKTMSTDGKNIYYNSEFVEKLSDEELIGTLCHEIWHILFFHHTRMGARNPELWNIAADLAINPICLEQNFLLPQGVCVPGVKPFETLPKDLTAEAYYELLKDPKNGIPQEKTNDNPIPSNGNGSNPDKDLDDDSDSCFEENDSSDSSSESDSDFDSDFGSDSTSDYDFEEDAEETPTKTNAPNETIKYKCPQTFGEVMPPGKATPEELREAESDTELMTEMAKQTAQMRGDLPGSLSRILAQKKPKVDWKHLLQEYLLKFSKSETVWTKPDKRFYPKYHLPSLGGKELGTIVFLIDTSGSINTNLLSAFAAEVNDFRSQHKKNTAILWHDVKVYKEEILEPDDLWEPKVKGGGGTCHIEVIGKALDYQPDLIVCLTDCYSQYPADPGVDTLFLRYGQGTAPAWGTTIDMEL